MFLFFNPEPFSDGRKINPLQSRFFFSQLYVKYLALLQLLRPVIISLFFSKNLLFMSCRLETSGGPYASRSAPCTAFHFLHFLYPPLNDADMILNIH